MKPSAEWLVPLAVGVVAGLGLWALAAGGGGAPEGGDGGEGTTLAPRPTEDVLAPFAAANVVENASVTFVVLAPSGRSAALDDVNRSTGPLGQFAWQSDHVALYSSEGGPWSCCAGRSHADGWPLPMANVVRVQDAGPRLFHDGHNATRVTAYVFDEAGALLASNAPASETARFTLHGDFFRLPGAAWYLGDNATAPNGTAHLPGLARPLVEKARPLLDGLPAGGVASTRSNAYVGLFGSLFVTLRVDSLILAP